LSRKPDRSRFRPREREIIDRLRTPRLVQDWLRSLRYNRELRGPTARTFRGVVRRESAHCLEGAMAAATILEQHGNPPIVLDLASQDRLDHVLLLYRRDGRWGSVGKSRDPALDGRKPVFRTVRDLAWSYVDSYVDDTGRIVGYGVFDLDELTRADWRLGDGNVWSVERALFAASHEPLEASDRRHRLSLRRYRAYRARFPHGIATDYSGWERWL
jgi:hypothetical protein